MPDADGYMTDEESKAHYREMLESNPGNRRVFEHCGKTWRVTEHVPPCVLCPECGEAMCGMSDAKCTATCDGCGKQYPVFEGVEFPKKKKIHPVADGLDDNDEFENAPKKFGHKECAEK